MTADDFPSGRLAAVHAAPAYLDRDRTVDKVESLTGEAARAGARLVAYPEAFVPGFPVWCLVRRPIDQHRQFEELYANSVEVPGAHTERLGQIAARHDVYLSVGITERSRVSMGGLFNANLVFAPSGRLVGHHRKLVATWAERLVWAPGDGLGLVPIETDVGRVGVLICGENTNPLARYTLMAQGEQLHIATWPPAWPFTRGGDAGDYRRWIEVRSAAHAFEGKVFSLSVAAYLDESAIMGAAYGDVDAEQILREAPPAVSLAHGPSGELLAGPVQGEEGILYLDADVRGTIVPKLAHDVICGYQRFDVFDLHVNRVRPAPATIRPGPASLGARPETTVDADLITGVGQRAGHQRSDYLLEDGEKQRRPG
ncbi:MAG: carbon-nitrogen hydrolase family protein [Solirubrobacterales bacterium]|nr:carbon-nitrogen hydrolase family protein [Solirubrobacterales bacterium]